MNEIPTNSIDLIITSPPYWNKVDYKHDKQLGMGLTYRQFLVNLQNNLNECMRVIKEDRFIIIIVADVRTPSGYRSLNERPRLYPLHADIIKMFLDMDFDFFQHFIWRKLGINKPKGKIVYGTVGSREYKGLASPPFLYTDFLMEHILVFRKPGERRELPSEKVRYEDSFNAINIEDAHNWVDPVWVIDSPSNENHPATFPTELVYRLIKMFSFKDETILDPFIGSGTVCEVAIPLNRNVIGYDVNENYINQIAKRYPTLTKSETGYIGIV